MFTAKNAGSTGLTSRAFRGKRFAQDKLLFSLDFSSEVYARSQLSRYGFQATCANPGWYFDGSVYRQAAVDDFRISSDFGHTGLLVEREVSNLCPYSSENNAAWIAAANTTKTNAPAGLFVGKTPMAVTGTATGANVSQNTGAFLDAYESYMLIFENDPVNPAAHVDFQVFAIGDVAQNRVRVNIAAGTTSDITATSARTLRRLLPVGPNGGEVWVLSLSPDNTMAAIYDRRIDIFPAPVSGAGKIYVHHVQVDEGEHSHYPLVSGAAAATKSADNIYTSTLPHVIPDSGIAVYTETVMCMVTDALRCSFSYVNNFGADYFLGGYSASLPAVATAGWSIASVTGTALTAPSTKNTLDPIGMAFSVSPAGVRAAIDFGVSADETTHTEVPPLTGGSMHLGSAAGVFYFLDGKLLKLDVFPQPMTLAQLESITT